ncbi:hypothetical protein [Aliifodinibius sp. S!AR15-10]|uniref:hypothetical protein n=1 Tax=Aliifodinibius sp. S!AR15-10 TaxID=2950437 RepID=UPI0028702673|nr:hypothetical protein [Aliifodinibius sp. S!AR15-10]
MLSASPDQSQWDMFSPILKSFIDPQHPLVQLADTLDWCQLETEFTELYSKTGRPAHPIRLMVSLLLLKQMYGHGDESLPEGMEKIFGWSVALHGRKAREQALCVDTTAGGDQHYVSHRCQAVWKSDATTANHSQTVRD